MARIAVVLGYEGTVAANVAIGLEKLGEVLFLVVDSEVNRRRRLLLESLARVVWLSGDLDEDVRRVKADRPDAILTYCEQWVCLTAELADRLGLPYHDIATARLLTDKVAQRRRLRETSVDAVWVETVSSAADIAAVVGRVSYPAVAKPRVGRGSAHVYQLFDAVGAERVLRHAIEGTSGVGELLVEEMLVGRPTAPFGDVVSVESLVTGGSATHLVTGNTPLAPPFRISGQHTPSGLADDELAAVEDLTGRALRALGVRTGITHTEVKLTAAGPRVIEVNGRLGGFIHELYLSAIGVDLIETAGRLALGEAAPPRLPASERVCFQYQNQPPILPCRLEDVRHPPNLLARPEIDDYVAFVQPGTELPGGVKTQGLDCVSGSAADFPAMFRALDDVLNELTFVFSFSGVRREITGKELVGYAERELADCPDLSGISGT